MQPSEQNNKRPENAPIPRPSVSSPMEQDGKEGDSFVGVRDRGGADPRKRKQTIGFYIAVGVAVIAVLIAAFLIFQTFAPQISGGRDANAAAGQLEGKTEEEIQAELNRIVDEGMFNISIASLVEFADGAAEGDLRIENVPSNPYLMKVEIARDDTNEIIYSSGLIEPNHHIQKATLAVDLDAGTYPCTAMFYAYELETEELIGQAAAEIIIEVRQ